MKTIVEQLSNYKSVHLNKSNVATHFIGIPLIIWSVALLLNLFSFELTLMNQTFRIGLATIVGLVVLVYYAFLYVPLALLVLIIFGPIIYSTHALVNHESSWLIGGGVFFIGWVLQFIGHHFEKAKPAFVDDLNQLLIGPLFLIAEIYFALKLNKLMEEDVYRKAVDIRNSFEQRKMSSTDV